MTVVAHASLAIKWVIPEEHSEEAIRLRNRWREAAELIVAPPIFRSEVTNAIYQRVRRGDLQPGVATDALEALLSRVAVVEPLRLYHQALMIAQDLSLGSTYDALYVALAEYEGCELWTADGRLVRSPRSRFPQVRWVAEAP